MTTIATYEGVFPNLFLVFECILNGHSEMSETADAYVRSCHSMIHSICMCIKHRDRERERMYLVTTFIPFPSIVLNLPGYFFSSSKKVADGCSVLKVKNKLNNIFIINVILFIQTQALLDTYQWYTRRLLRSRHILQFRALRVSGWDNLLVVLRVSGWDNLVVVLQFH